MAVCPYRVGSSGYPQIAVMPMPGTLAELCDNCGAPVDWFCRCEDCILLKVKPYCHLCRELFRAAARNPWMEKCQHEDAQAGKTKRNRMGLD